MRLFTGFPVGETFKQAASALGPLYGKIKGLRTVSGINLHVTACFIGKGSVQPHVTLARFKDFTDIRQIPLEGYWLGG